MSTSYTNRTVPTTTWTDHFKPALGYDSPLFLWDDSRLVWDQDIYPQYTVRTKPTTNWTNHTKP